MTDQEDRRSPFPLEKPDREKRRREDRPGRLDETGEKKYPPDKVDKVIQPDDDWEKKK